VINVSVSRCSLSLFAATYLGIVGSSVLLILPLFVGGLASGLHLTSAQAGWLGSADLIGYAIGSVLAFLIIDRTSQKHLILVGLALLIVGNLASVGLRSTTLLFAVRVLLTGLGAGLVIAVPYSSLSAMDNPERSTGIYWTFNVLGGSIALLVLPTIIRLWGITGLFLTLAALATSALPIGFLKTDNYASTTVAAETRALKNAGPGIIASIPTAAMMVLGAIMLFNLGLGGVWAFVDRPAGALSLDERDTGIILSGAYLVCMLGSSVAAWQGSRFGYIRPYAAAMALVTVAVYSLNAPPSILAYAGTLCLLNFCWNYAITFQFLALYASDATGRSAALIFFAQSAGLMLGPGLAGTLVSRFSYAIGLSAAMLLCALSALMLSMTFLVKEPEDRTFASATISESGGRGG
jgi:MFS family permease